MRCIRVKREVVNFKVPGQGYCTQCRKEYNAERKAAMQALIGSIPLPSRIDPQNAEQLALLEKAKGLPEGSLRAHLKHDE